MIAWRIIISGSTAPIFAVFSLNESVVCADDRSGPVFPINGKFPTFIALAFRNGMGYRYLNVCINSVNDASISCKNFMNLLSSNSRVDRAHL